MSTTLTNGLKLPDKGSVDWYADMQNNYTILDGAVGTVAEHTSALAGKAPLGHTHTKSDITDFPAYGNTAGTICEGNDSRLSDARTPVAHTHGKADITDLFNSANVWGNTNTFTRNADDSFLLFKNTNINALVPTDTNAHFTDLNFFEVNSKIIGKVRSSGTRSRITTEITARSWSADGTTNEEVKLNLVSDIQHSDKRAAINSNFMPSANNSYDLGTSTNKWKTLNGINPGALSLPDMSSGTGVSLSAGSNSYSPPSSGWLSINLTGAISVVCGNFCHSGTDMLSVPVVKGSTYTVTVATSGTAYLFVSQGNV